jgi:hypothetical protein
MASNWIKHVMSVKRANKNLTLKQAMKKASQTYKKQSHPHKRQPSRTRKGRLDFVTHKGDKCYNVKGKRQCKKRRPYRSRKGGRR